MSENLKAFLAKVSADAQLIERLKAAKEYGEIIALAKEIGVELTLADIEPENSELSEEELNVVPAERAAAASACWLVAAAERMAGMTSTAALVWPMVRAATEAKTILPVSALLAARV